MMAKSPRVIIIDDELSHLNGLADGLNQRGIPCYRVHYKGEPDDILPCPDARLIIADLHLGSGVLAVDPTTDFSVLGTLLEEAIRPSGPYSILLWTMYPGHASGLQEFLERLQSVPKPVTVEALSKADYLDNDGFVRDEEGLNGKIDTLADGWLRPRGAVALVGAWGELDNEEVDALIDEIYIARQNEVARPEGPRD